MTTYVPQALILFLWYPKNKVPKSWWKKNNVYFKIKGYTTWAAGEKVGVSMETSPKMSPLGNRANFPNASEKQNMGWGSAYWTVTLSEALVVGRRGLRNEPKGSSSKFLLGDDRKVEDDSSGCDIRYFLARCWGKDDLDDITLQTKIKGNRKLMCSLAMRKWWWNKRHRIWALPCLQPYDIRSPPTPPTSFGVILPQTQLLHSLCCSSKTQGAFLLLCFCLVPFACVPIQICV